MIPSVSPLEAERLVSDQQALVLDVRTPGEFAELGHIPGAWLLPVDLIASAPAVLPADVSRVVVCCEHGVRSRVASEWLLGAGVTNVVNMLGGMSVWAGPREFGLQPLKGPSDWLLQNADVLPRQGGTVLDAACGRGRHALLLASAGFSVEAIDRDEEALNALERTAEAAGLPLVTRTLDLEGDAVDLGEARYAAVLVFRFLHRPLLPALIRAIEPGGVLIYETFTRGQAVRGHVTNPAFLLDEGELPSLVAPLVVERQREGDVDGWLIASVVARKASR